MKNTLFIIIIIFLYVPQSLWSQSLTELLDDFNTKVGELAFEMQTITIKTSENLESIIPSSVRDVSISGPQVLIHTKQIHNELSKRNLRWPVYGYMHITSFFGVPRRNQLGYHTGVDIYAPLNTAVVSILPGIVLESKWRNGYGNHIKIQHSNNVISTYSHLNRIHVKVNQKVHSGMLIGYIGSTGNATGNHLHFEVLKNGKFIDPMLLYKK